MNKQHRHFCVCHHNPQCNRRYVHSYLVATTTTEHDLMYVAGMFATNHHAMVGSHEDPPDGGKVAVAVFTTVAIYGVSISK